MQIARSDEEILSCFSVLKQLRENLVRDQFVATIRAMNDEGYELAFLREGGEVVSVAGFRTYINLFIGGRTVYVYDLVTAEQHRSKGYGEQLLDALIEHAQAAGCLAIHLDSGVQRFRAHKFYLQHGFEIRAHHFVKRLD